MAWVPFLIASWLLIDVLVVAAFITASRRRARRERSTELLPRRRTPQLTARVTRRTVR